MEVEEYTTGEWIEDLKFAYYAPGREVVRDVHVGERLYGPVRQKRDNDRSGRKTRSSYGRHNQIKELPEYLVGADFIRTHYADKIYWGNSFITFTATEDIDVFIMKHEKSRADLSDWILVEEDFPVEPKVYFKGGADIYTKHYRQGETVTIPGSKVRSGGWGNLVFVQYAQGNYIRVISPHPEDALIPFAKERYCAVVLGLEYDTVEWHKRIGEGDWEELGTGLNGEMTVPFVETTTAMELKASLYDEAGEFVADKVAEYVIRNEFEVLLLNPGPGTEALPDENTTIVYAARDVEGNAIPAESVAWQYSTDRQNWVSIIGNTFYTPPMPGRVYVKAEAESMPGITQEAEYFIDVVEAYGTTAINFGKDEGEVYTLGETMEMHENGKYYGFNEDHTDRVKTFLKVKENRGMVDETSIRLKEGGAFEYATGNGIFLVKAFFGPVDDKDKKHRYYDWKKRHGKDDEMKAVIEGEEIVVTENRHRRVCEYEVLVTVEDGKLTITGTEGLPVVQVDVKEMTEEEAEKWKERPPETGPPWDGDEDEEDKEKEKDRKDYGKGGRR